jgi:hypothetical protein
MNMILTLSRHTSNDITALLAQPFHYVLGLHNLLLKQSEEAEKQQQQMQEQYAGGYSKPAMPRMPSSVSYKSPMGGSQMSFK